MAKELNKNDIGAWCLIKGLSHVKGEPFIDQYIFKIMGINGKKFLICFPGSERHLFAISPSKIEVQKLNYIPHE